MSKKIITPAAAIVGAALAGSLTAINVASAADNPFAAKPLSSGYMQLAEDDTSGEKQEAEGKGDEGKENGEGTSAEGKEKMEGKCGEGKCGSKM